MATVFSSCKKESVSPSGSQIPVPVYAEGIYHPCMKIATVTEDGELSQEWNWSGANLDYITQVGDGTTAYSYSGDYITKVVSNYDLAEELRYTYDGTRMSRCEVYYSGALAISVDFQHNAAGRISGGNVTIDDNFLLSLAGSLLGKGSAFEKLMGTPAATTLVQMAQTPGFTDGRKFSISNKTFTVAFDWNGENVDRQILSGSLTLNVNTEDLELIQQFLPIPEEYQSVLQMIQAAMTMMGGSLPLQVTLADTATATYDTMYNPYFCNWGEIVSQHSLSRANPLVVNNHFVVAISVNLMGQQQPLFTRPQDTLEEYTYEYNDKHYPTKALGAAEVIFTYKQQ